MKKTVYDKVKWHYPEGHNCPDLKSAMIHIKAVLDWFHEHEMLTLIGKEIFDLGIDSETSITSDMLTETGNRIMQKCYNEILKNLQYGEIPPLECFTSVYASIS